MNRLRALLRELVGLFVDDGAFAAAIVAWVLVAALLLRFVHGVAPWRGPLLFLGLAAILVESCLRFARTRRI
jgi:hypothetical protein